MIRLRPATGWLPIAATAACAQDIIATTEAIWDKQCAKCHAMNQEGKVAMQSANHVTEPQLQALAHPMCTFVK